MLQNLHVKNLALIDEAEVDFSGGLNILTGETGAGKSIILGSVSLALGGRYSADMLRKGADKGLVELTFYVENPETVRKLEEMDLSPDGGQIIITRRFNGNRSVSRINGETVTLGRLKEAAQVLIDIHGQHEHQSLLSKKKHLEILDTFAKESLGDKKEKLAQCYQEYRKLKDELEHANLDGEERARELSFLEYEVKEIEDAQLTVGEDEELEAVFRKYSNGKKIMDAVGAANAATSEDDESASERIGRALRELSSVSAYDEHVKEMEEQLTEIDNLLSDFNHELASYLSDEEFDEETFYETEKRLDLINHLKSKYGNTIADILKYGEEKAERITVLNDYDAYLAGLQKNVSEKEKQLEQLSRKVSDIRKKESKKLTESIKNALLDLNFLDVQFMMEFAETDYTANGIDDAQFLISTNPGEPVKPLGKVASGGELSRIMLAIKTVMASDKIGTLIFDEIDSGISGRTAQMVSEKMNALGRSHQIICITHLPQIAAMADSHFLIEKSVENQATVSKIHKLTDEESVEELARMLGGVEITDTVLENAREMKQMAYMKK